MRPTAAMIGLALIALAHASYGQNRFDPAGYIQAKEAQPGLREGDVVVKGVKYRVFTSPAGNLYVPVVENLNKASLERGLCANEIPQLLERCAADDLGCMQRNRDRMSSEVTVVRADAPLTENTKAYAEIIATTIRRKCGDVAPAYFSPLFMQPELGIEYKDTHQRDPTTYKIYNEGLKPQVGFKSEF